VRDSLSRRSSVFVVAARAGQSAKRDPKGEQSKSSSFISLRLWRYRQRAAYDRRESRWDAAGVSISCRRREA